MSDAEITAEGAARGVDGSLRAQVTDSEAVNTSCVAPEAPERMSPDEAARLPPFVITAGDGRRWVLPPPKGARPASDSEQKLMERQRLGADAIDFLRSMPWQNLDCPTCHATPREPHAPGCRLRAILEAG